MISCQLKGGLGNMMFQIAATTALALRNNDECYFDLQKHTNSPRPQAPATQYIDNVFRNVKNAPCKSGPTYSYDSLVYKNIVYVPNMILDGYFQSEKYFFDKKEEVRKLFEPTEEIKQYIINKYGDLSNCVSLHVRRGDYTWLQHVYHICTADYYREALANFPNKKIIILSDDISWCKQNFHLYDTVYIQNETDFIDLYIMSLCEHNIIANSSFSWWGSWLNCNINKKVIAPKNWFRNHLNHNTVDIYCPAWSII